MTAHPWPNPDLIDYDSRTAPERGPAYHRNGVAGNPFIVEVTDGDILRVHFATDAEEFGAERSVALWIVDAMAVEHPRTDGLRRFLLDPEHERAVAVFDWHSPGTAAPVTYVAVADLANLTGINRSIAVFEHDRLPDVRFGHNSHRGDHFYDQINRWLSDARVALSHFRGSV